VIPQQIKRIAAPLQGQLKGQFGVIADQVSTMILTLGRGGNDQHRVRAMREYVAQIRQALDVAAFKVEEQHTVTDEGPAA
jgi:Spy/CpxP family protein refolding chaperone